MRTYPDPMQRSHQEAISLRDAPDAEALRAENERLRKGIEAIRDFAKDREYLIYCSDVVCACEALLRKETP